MPACFPAAYTSRRCFFQTRSGNAARHRAGPDAASRASPLALRLYTSAVTKTAPILNSLLLRLLIYLGYEVNSRFKPPQSLPPSLELAGLGITQSHPRRTLEPRSGGLRLRGCCQLCGPGGERARSIQGQEACRRTGIKRQVLFSQ